MGDATPAPTHWPPPEQATDPAPASVVLVTIDALAASAMGAYGNARKTTPKLDRWAGKALRFDRAYTTGGWTTLALGALFRGRYPRRLQWTRLLETNRYRLLRAPAEPKLHPGEQIKKVFMMPLEDPGMSLQHLLRRRGMHTMAVVDDAYTYVLAKDVGAFRDFDHYDEVPELSGKRANDEAVTRLSIQRLRAAPKDRPFFLWAHYFGPHVPDSVHEGTLPFGSDVEGRYLHEVAFTDQHVGKLLQAVDQIAKQRPVSVILTADHGEVLYKRWRGHGHDLREEGIRVPLFVKAPGVAPGATSVLASTVDVMPTVLAMTATPAPPYLDGVSLVELGERPRPRIVLSDTWRLDEAGTPFIDMTCAVDGRRKYVLHLTDLRERLVSVDDANERNLLGHERAPALEAAVAAYLESDGVLRVRD